MQPINISNIQKGTMDFTIYVVGGMATGKSTLIDALIGKKLMPYNHTSHSLICIEYANINNFQGVAYDEDEREIMKDDNLTRHTLQEWNDDERISFINVKGRIPFLNTLGVKVRIVEVTILNNKDYLEFLRNIICERSLVVNIACADRFLSNDEWEHIQHICDMTKCDVQFHDRFFFAINQMDVFNPEEESIEDALVKIKANLENRGIFNPNLFPVSAQAALEARTKPTIEQVLPVYKQYIKHFPSTHFDAYYQFSHLPNLAQIETEKLLTEAYNDTEKERGKYTTIEIHSGIVSIEKAITLYINKYNSNY